MIIGCTGPRPHKLYAGVTDVKKFLDGLISRIYDTLLANKAEMCYCGMALGLDTVFAELALSMKLPLTCVLPCRGQEDRWSNEDKRRYLNIINRAESVIYVSKDTYTVWCMQERNKFIVNNVDKLIAVWDGEIPGGTANTVEYARKVLRPEQIIQINPKPFR